MKRFLSPIIIIAAIAILFILISRTQKVVEDKKEKKENVIIKANIDTMAMYNRYIKQIEDCNKLYVEAQEIERNTRIQNNRIKTQILNKLNEKVSDNPNPDDVQLLSDIANLADAISEARSLDTIKR